MIDYLEKDVPGLLVDYERFLEQVEHDCIDPDWEIDVDKDDVVSELARELCRPSITLDRSLEVILLIVKDAEVVEDEATLGDRAKGLAEAQTLLE